MKCGNSILKMERNTTRAISLLPAETQGEKGDCKYWTTFGNCKKGEDCDFEHAEDRRGRSRNGTPRGPGAKRLCIDYTQGKCAEGKKCNLWHPPVCRDYKTGECQTCQDCGYMHVDEGGNPYATESPEERGRSRERANENNEKHDDGEEDEEDAKKNKKNKKDRTG